MQGEKVGEWHNNGVPAKPSNGGGESGARIWHTRHQPRIPYQNFFFPTYFLVVMKRVIFS